MLERVSTDLLIMSFMFHHLWWKVVQGPTHGSSPKEADIALTYTSQLLYGVPALYMRVDAGSGAYFDEGA